MSIELENAIRDWPLWPVASAPELKTIYTAGLNHSTGLIKTTHEQWVLKVFSTDGELSIKAQQWAAHCGVAPDVVYHPNDFRYCVMNVAGTETLADALNNSVSISDTQLNSLGVQLSTLHANDVTKLGFQASRFDIHYWCNLYSRNAGFKAQAIHAQMLNLLDHFAADDTPWCFCHNDLVAANCFASEKHTAFIDWEYAQLHNPWFDLAGLIYYLKLNTEQAKLLLNAYQALWGNKHTEKIFFSSQCAMLWGDMLWHLDRFGEEFWPQLESKRRDLLSLTQQFGISLEM
ncbi:MAG: phosphotransferase [Pseudomonadales bacterium]